MTQPQDMREWVFTFGSGQRGYAIGRSGPDENAKGFRLDDRYVVIEGTYESARDRMFDIFGPIWSMQYRSREKAGVEEFGLTELVVTKDWPAVSDD